MVFSFSKKNQSKGNCLVKYIEREDIVTETLELPGVLVPYPEDGREATDHRRPSILQNPLQYLMVLDKNIFQWKCEKNLILL